MSIGGQFEFKFICMQWFEHANFGQATRNLQYTLLACIYFNYLATLLNLQEAVRWLLSGKTIFDPKAHPMGDYNYCGSNRWSGRERQQFRRAWKVHRKQFNMLRSTVSARVSGSVK